MSNYEIEPTPEPEAQVEDAPVVDEAPSWQPPGQEWYTQQEQFMHSAMPVLQQLGQILQEPDEEPEYDPTFADERGQFDQQQLQQYVQSQVEQHLSPWQGILGQVAQQKGQEVATQHLDEIAKEVGEFDRDQAIVLATQFMEQGVDPAQALREAATRQSTFEKKIREDAIRDYEEKLRAVAQAPSEPSAGLGAAGEVQKIPTGPDRYEKMAERWVAQNGQPMQVTP